MLKRSLVCIGAGRCVKKVASLCLEAHAQVLILDPDKKRLEKMPEGAKMRCVSITDIAQMQQLLSEGQPLIAALADSDETNLVTSHIASQQGSSLICAAFSQSAYRFVTQQFGVTHALFPNQLVVQELLPAILLPGSLPYGSFALGSIQMRLFRIPENWEKSAKPISELQIPRGICIGCIRRLQKGLDPLQEHSYRLIIPHGEDYLLAGDEIVCFGEASVIKTVPYFFGLKTKHMQEVIVGGKGEIAKELIQFLIARQIPVRYVEEDQQSSLFMKEQFPECITTLQTVEQWSEERLEKVKEPSLFIACNQDFAHNLEQGLLAKQAGYNVFVTEAGSTREKNQALQLGLQAISSQENLVAERIISLLSTEPSIYEWYLYDHAILLMQLVISSDSHAVGLSLALFFTSVKNIALVLAVEHRGLIFTPTGQTILFPGDRILVITPTSERDAVLKLFL